MACRGQIDWRDSAAASGVLIYPRELNSVTRKRSVRDCELNSKEEHFGGSKVQSLLTRHDGESPLAIVNRIFAELDEFREGVALTDDQTVVAMKVIG